MHLLIIFLKGLVAFFFFSNVKNKHCIIFVDKNQSMFVSAKRVCFPVMNILLPPFLKVVAMIT